MTAPITPDERAAMRARYPAGPIHESDLLAMGMRALDDVPRLLDALDALDTAEQRPGLVRGVVHLHPLQRPRR